MAEFRCVPPSHWLTSGFRTTAVSRSCSSRFIQLFGGPTLLCQALLISIFWRWNAAWVLAEGVA